MNCIRDPELKTENRPPASAHGVAASALAGTVTEPIRPEFTSTTTTRSDPLAALESRRSSKVSPSFMACRYVAGFSLSPTVCAGHARMLSCSVALDEKNVEFPCPQSAPLREVEVSPGDRNPESHARGIGNGLGGQADLARVPRLPDSLGETVLQLHGFQVVLVAGSVTQRRHRAGPRLSRSASDISRRPAARARNPEDTWHCRRRPRRSVRPSCCSERRSARPPVASATSRNTPWMGCISCSICEAEAAAIAELPVLYVGIHVLAGAGFRPLHLLSKITGR